LEFDALSKKGAKIMNNTPQIDTLSKIANLVRYYILTATTKAGSGHPTSALSATDLMTCLFFGGIFRYDVKNPDHYNNDRIIFSKGHASPLFYALWAAAGQITVEEMFTYRNFGSPLEGHPTPAFRYVDAATGSLGQGLSIGLGMALNAKYLDNLPYRTYVLLGDSEMAEGSQWEAIQIAAHYKLGNLVGIIDVNRLGQRGETMYGHNLSAYVKRIEAFGWKTATVDGHSLPDIMSAFMNIEDGSEKPVMIVAKTIKGKGVSFVEDKNGFHGKALDEDDLNKALEELGEVDKTITGQILTPENRIPEKIEPKSAGAIDYTGQDSVPTRTAYGNALNRIYPAFPQIVSIDGEVSNSTRAARFKEEHPDRFFEMYIAEQNMAGTSLGLACRNKIPFVSSFAAFLSRAYDQIRMSQYSDANIKFVGSHAGVSIGQDGPSQMGLEDLAFFRTLLGSVVLYPCDAVSTEKLVEEAAKLDGLVYVRTTRSGTPIIYGPGEPFPIGGCKVVRKSNKDLATVVTAGITVHEALDAHEQLKTEGIGLRVIDLYCIKPVDVETLKRAAEETPHLITVEDHFAEGGIGDAVRQALSAEGVPVHSLAVRKKPKSGKPRELIEFEEIGKTSIINKVKELV
jgi:transketolase